MSRAASCCRRACTEGCLAALIAPRRRILLHRAREASRGDGCARMLRILISEAEPSESTTERHKTGAALSQGASRGLWTFNHLTTIGMMGLSNANASCRTGAVSAAFFELWPGRFVALVRPINRWMFK